MIPLSLREEKKRATRHELANAAYALAREVGVDETTTDAIAARAGYSRRTFANHFTCKQEAIVHGFFASIAPWGLAAEVSVDMLPTTADELIDGTAAYITGLVSGEALERIFSFAALIRSHPALEPYLLAGLHSLKDFTKSAQLDERFGEEWLSMFVGATLGVISGILRPLVSIDLPDGVPDSTPGSGARPGCPAGFAVLDLNDQTRAAVLARVEQAFELLRNGFGQRGQLP